MRNASLASCEWECTRACCFVLAARSPRSQRPRSCNSRSATCSSTSTTSATRLISLVRPFPSPEFHFHSRVVSAPVYCSLVAFFPSRESEWLITQRFLFISQLFVVFVPSDMRRSPVHNYHNWNYDAELLLELENLLWYYRMTRTQSTPVVRLSMYVCMYVNVYNTVHFSVHWKVL